MAERWFSIPDGGTDITICSDIMLILLIISYYSGPPQKWLRNKQTWIWKPNLDIFVQRDNTR